MPPWLQDEALKEAARWRSTSSTEPTSSSGTTTPCPRRATRAAWKWRCARHRRFGALPHQRRRDAPRRRRPITSSSRSETACGPATRRAPESSPPCSASFRCSKTRSRALGVPVWPMVEYEADDALAAAAERAASDPDVNRVIICTPDKDLAQSVRGTRIVQMDRRRRTIRDEAGVVLKFGVSPSSIPDYLALVGDAADGYPGPAGLGGEIHGGGARPLRASRGHSGRLEELGVNAANPAALSRTLARDRDLALLFRDLATLRTDLDLFESVDELRWKGPTPEFAPLAARLDGAAS